MKIKSEERIEPGLTLQVIDFDEKEIFPKEIIQF